MKGTYNLPAPGRLETVRKLMNTWFVPSATQGARGQTAGAASRSGGVAAGASLSYRLVLATARNCSVEMRNDLRQMIGSDDWLDTLRALVRAVPTDCRRGDCQPKQRRCGMPRIRNRGSRAGSSPLSSMPSAMTPGFVSSGVQIVNGSSTTAHGAGRKSGVTCSPVMQVDDRAARLPRFAGFASGKLPDHDIESNYRGNVIRLLHQQTLPVDAAVASSSRSTAARSTFSGFV